MIGLMEWTLVHSTETEEAPWNLLHKSRAYDPNFHFCPASSQKWASFLHHQWVNILSTQSIEMFCYHTYLLVFLVWFVFFRVCIWIAYLCRSFSSSLLAIISWLKNINEMTFTSPDKKHLLVPKAFVNTHCKQGLGSTSSAALPPLAGRKW